MTVSKQLNFDEWITENKQVIESELINKGSSFLAYQSQGNFSGVPVLDNQWHNISMSGKNKGKVGYRGLIRYTSKQVPQLTLTLNHFRDGSITFKDSVIHDLWTNYKSEFQQTSDKPKYTIEQALIDYQQAAPTTNHPYLTKKQVSDHPISDNLNIRLLPSKNALLIPLVNADLQIQSVQLIYANGFKHNPLGSSKQGAFYPIGESPKTTTKIVVAGGFATAFSLYQAKTAPCVVNAIDDGNIPTVIKILQILNPKAEIILAADDDHINESEGKGNSGLTKGRKNAMELGIKWTYPSRDKLGNGSDFNDVHCTQGIDAVLEQFQANLSVPPLASAAADKPVKQVNKNTSTVKIPHGYRVENGNLFKVKTTEYKDGSVKESLIFVYKGIIEVLACEIDADTNSYKLLVKFQANKGKCEIVSVPLEEIATGRGVIANLAKRGAKIQEQQARLVSEYLIRFYAHNENILPTNSTTQFLGISGKGIITPLKSVGTDTQYQGPLKLAVGNDKDAYPNAIKEIVSWGEPAWPLLFTLSMSLISPFLPRLQFRRNPIICFLGQSNSGKTTSALFANGVWGDSERAPFKVDGSGKTTSVGLAQNQLLLNGLPWLLDEIHKMRNFMIESAIYEWANKQTRVYGSPEGTPKGGTPLHGTLLLCGENLPQLENKGATNRLLMIDVAENPPLGVGGKIKNHGGELVCNPEGARRAKVLEHAWINGMGLLGTEFSEYLISNWDSFSSAYQVNLNKMDGDLEQWAGTAAVSVTTLDYLLTFLGIADKSIVDLIPQKVGSLLNSYRSSDKDPDISAWDSLQAMIAVASENNGVWQLNSEVVWWKMTRLDGTECYCVPIGTRAFKNYVGAASKYTQSWLVSGLIIGQGKGGDKVSESIKNPENRKKVKCLLIPIDADTDIGTETTDHQSQNGGGSVGGSVIDTQGIDNNNIYIPEPPKPPRPPTHAHTQGNSEIGSKTGLKNKNISNPKIVGGFSGSGGLCENTQQTRGFTKPPAKPPEQNQANFSGGRDNLTPPDWFNDLHSQPRQSNNDITEINGNAKHPDFDDQPTVHAPQIINESLESKPSTQGLSCGDIVTLICKFPRDDRYDIRQKFESKQKVSKSGAVEWLQDKVSKIDVE